jgi:mono/diheme cytochrome c family protein
LEEQVYKSGFNLRALIIMALVLGLLLLGFGLHQLQQLSDPYVQQVLALHGDVQQGQAIFQMNCSGCHGIDAHGEVGPSLWKVSDHRSQISIIRQVTSGKTPPMPKFQASPEEMANLLSYLDTL